MAIRGHGRSFANVSGVAATRSARLTAWRFEKLREHS
jgi:hypothetical protein